MYLFDEGEVGRNKYSSSKTPGHHYVTAFVEMLDVDDGGDREDVNYIINAEIHRCIRG